MLLSLLASLAHAGPDATRDALDRLEELVELRLEDGTLAREDVLPLIVVSAKPRYEASGDWYGTSVLQALTGALGSSGVRVCEACMAPRAWVDDGRVTYQTGPIGLDEVIRLDEQTRGTGPAAHAAIWVDEHAGGVVARIVDLRTARVLWAQNIDPALIENDNTERIYTLSEELERRARGDSVTQAFVDIGLYPSQHVSLDWTDQWGKTNSNLSGLSISLFDPVVGIGATHARRIPVMNTLIGGKVLFSVPTALVRAVGGDVGQDIEILDPLLTGTAFTRVPFGRSNYGFVASVSTNGRVALGISLMNINLLPVIP